MSLLTGHLASSIYSAILLRLCKRSDFGTLPMQARSMRVYLDLDYHCVGICDWVDCYLP